MKILKRKTLAALLALSLLASLLPLGAQPAQAAAPNGQVIYVGGVEISSTGYWTTDSNGSVTAYTDDGAPADNYIHYNAANNTLTLHNATIKKGLDYSESTQGGTYINGSAIGVFNQSGNAELTIRLVGTNTIANVGKGIFVLASSASTGSSNLTIQGDGSLNASASQTGIWVQSNGNNAALCVENAEVTASADGAVKNGVLVQAKDGSDVSLTVNGGSLTASVNANIWFQFGSGASGSGTPTVTVGNNAIIRANGGIANNSPSPIQYKTGSGSTGGIVFDNGTGTVYGDVELQEDLTIGKDESLTIPNGSSLTIPDDKTLTNKGEVKTDGSGSLTNSGTINNSGTLPNGIGGTVNHAPKITTTTLPNGIVGTAYNQTLSADGTTPITWSVTSGSLPAGLSLNGNTITGTPTAAGTYTFTVTATNSAGSDSEEYTLTIKAVSVTDVSLNKETLSLYTGDTASLTATVEPDNATNKNVTWSSDKPAVATVEGGTVTAMGAGEATITVTTEDGSKTATCTVIVHTATTITTQPQNVSVTEGQSATFSVAASGDNLRYQWQINSGNGWSAITGATDASYTIDRTTTAMSGNQYRCIVTGNGGETTSSAATLTVRSYEPPYTGKYSYELTTSVGDHGSLTVDRYATEGEKVTITVTPDEAYKLDDLSVTAGGKDVELVDNGDGTFSFTMPSADVKISATFAEDPDWTEPEEPATDVSDIFLDIAPNAWYKDAVQYAYDSGLMTGVSANEFAPEATTTRAMIVSMLARLEGVESAESAGFTDVAANDWYATAVNWAAASGITSGTGDGNFSPNTAITREQLAAILMNYAQYKGQDVSARATLDTYNDATAISNWANDVMSWAVAEGLISGVTADTLQPQGAATRAQVAAILQRFLSE